LSHGGRTDLHDGILLCGHHHLIHDPTYQTTRQANGDYYRFHGQQRVLTG
jgi:hypothetical protein